LYGEDSKENAVVKDEKVDKGVNEVIEEKQEENIADEEKEKKNITEKEKSIAQEEHNNKKIAFKLTG
jgi:hypothetical protein